MRRRHDLDYTKLVHSLRRISKDCYPRGVEDGGKLRVDTTVVETDNHRHDQALHTKAAGR
jgi:hypothetical protein